MYPSPLSIGVISIHTTLAGGDAAKVMANNTSARISIHTTLAGGDLGFLFYPMRPFCISIHTTLAGGDIPSSTYKGGENISIHTTLAGGDGGLGRFPHQSKTISIHTTLAGGDERCVDCIHVPILFQSTPPSRVATVVNKISV